MPSRLIGKQVGIHAAKRDTRDEREFWEDIVTGDDMFERAFAAIGIKSYADLPADAKAACDRMAKNGFADKPDEQAKFKAGYVKNYFEEA